MATPAVGHATALSAAAKRYTSAVCLVPPRSTWAPLQEARCFADMSFVRWCAPLAAAASNRIKPHQTADRIKPQAAAREPAVPVPGSPALSRGRTGSSGGPGVAQPLPGAGQGAVTAAAAAETCGTACLNSRPPPLQVTLSELCHFEHGRSCTLWVRPDPTEGGRALHPAGAHRVTHPPCPASPPSGSPCARAPPPPLPPQSWRRCRRRWRLRFRSAAT